MSGSRRYCGEQSVNGWIETLDDAYLNSSELKARNTVKERKYPVFNPMVCAVEA